jgi:hypothetical protein
MSVSMIQGGIVLMATYLLAMFMILSIGPVIDEVDNMRDTVDTHTFTVANLTFDSFHAWFYGVIVAGCAILTLWFFMIVHAKVVLRRQERMMYGNYPYTRTWGMRPR